MSHSRGKGVVTVSSNNVTQDEGPGVTMSPNVTGGLKINQKNVSRII